MTPFKAWLKACKEMNQQVTLLEKGENKTGDCLCLYVLIRQIPPIPVYGHGWNSAYERYYILWINYEKFQSFTDYHQALMTYQNRCNQYVFDDVPWN